jgi:hypothetical protein
VKVMKTPEQKLFVFCSGVVTVASQTTGYEP